jgi:hypothetical protein
VENGQIFIYGTAVTGTPDGNQQDLRVLDGNVDFADCGTNWVKVSTVHGGLGTGYQVELGYYLWQHTDGSHEAKPFTEYQTPYNGAPMTQYNYPLTFALYYTFKEVHAGSGSNDFDMYFALPGQSWTKLTTYSVWRSWIDPRGETERRGTGTAADDHDNMRWRDSSGTWHSNWTPAVSVGSIPGYNFVYISSDEYRIEAP